MVLKKFKSLFSGSPNSPKALRGVATRETQLAAETPFCAIGDVHGRLDLLDPLFNQLRDRFGDEVPIVFLGDMVDRGPDSAGVLKMVRDLTLKDRARNIAICGNHEQMMIEFIDDPAGKGARWLSFGGIETLQSFGITKNSVRYDADDALEAADALEDALPDGMLDWLRALPAMWRNGNIFCVHAGMDPTLAADQQKTRVLINGHPKFLSTPRDDGITVLHGHTVMESPVIWDGRISIDTGAYKTGLLTAAYLSGDTCTFLS